MRIDLSDLQPSAYAVLKDQVPYGLTKRMMGNTDKDGNFIDTTAFIADTLKTLVTEWGVKDTDGKLMPLPRDAKDEELENVDTRIIEKVIEHAHTLLKRSVPDPK